MTVTPVSELDLQFVIDIFSQLENAQVGKLGASELVIFLDANLPEYQPDVSPGILEMIREGRENSTESVRVILDFLLNFSTEKSKELFSTTDFLVTPTLPFPPPPIEALLTDEGYDSYSDQMLNFTIIGTFFWGAAITVPNGFDNESLPVGLQIIGPHGTDRDLLAIVSTIEDVYAMKSGGTTSTKEN